LRAIGGRFISVGGLGSDGGFATVSLGARLTADASLMRALAPRAARRTGPSIGGASFVGPIIAASFAADSIAPFVLATDAISLFSLAARSIAFFSFIAAAFAT
jgi:hypothetical protein